MSYSFRDVVFCFLLATTLVLHGDRVPSGLFVVCQNTNFSFPIFSGTERNRLIMLGDVSAQNSSIYMNDYYYSNSFTYSCGRFLYPDVVRMQDPSYTQVASFSTSFTFEINLNRAMDAFGRYTNSDGLAFTITPDNNTHDVNGEILCNNKAIPTRIFAVEVDTWLNSEDGDPSDSHIAVDINNVIHDSSHPQYVYNLCKPPQNITGYYCGYFANNAGPFTVWIDYDGPSQMLAVHFSAGSNTTSKPAATRIINTMLDLHTMHNEFMYVGFSGSFGVYGEAHRILSWNFSSSGLSIAPSPQAQLSPAPSPQALKSPDSQTASNPLTNVGIISGIIAGVLGACATIILLGTFLFCYCRRRKKNQRNQPSSFKLPLMGPRIFSYRELSKATKDFNESELVGSGGFGAVYKGTLHPSGVVVAVKRCTRPENPHAEEGFVAEATSISQIRQRNLVQLQGWCQERGQLLLVYDYMPNRSLDEWLFNSFPRVVHECNPGTLLSDVLTWDLRFNILAGVAAALAYLHEEWEQCVLHRDIKSSNVMLDGEFNAHLGDFGLARLIDHQKAEKTTMMAGTLGYMAPEMYYTGKASKETDVYSFGVLILEVVCGRKPLNKHALNPEDVVLVDSVWRAHEAGDLLSVADPRLGTYDHIASLSARVSNKALEDEFGRGLGFKVSAKPCSVTDVLRLGLLCCQQNPSKRPSMRLVKQMFHTGDGAALPPLPAAKPPIPTT